MRPNKFLTKLTVAVSCMLLFAACNSGEKTESETTTIDTMASKMESTTPPVAKVDSNLLVIQYKVTNFANWKTGYEANDSMRLAHGLHNYVIGRGMDDSNMVVVALNMDDVNKAKEFSASPLLKERMKKAGVSKPTFNYLHYVVTDDSKIEQTVRVRINHKVKDWDAFKTEFDKHKQARIDAGLVDRRVGHSFDDNHMVSIVLAITDMKKAKDFMASKDLKDKMAAAGVEGAPDIFFFDVVQRFQ
ncbi:MAG: hypothetical protein V4556_00305 [Bacteroidota bacterium]